LWMAGLGTLPTLRAVVAGWTAVAPGGRIARPGDGHCLGTGVARWRGGRGRVAATGAAAKRRGGAGGKRSISGGGGFLAMRDACLK